MARKPVSEAQADYYRVWLMKYSVIGRAMTRKRLSDLLRRSTKSPEPEVELQTTAINF